MTIAQRAETTRAFNPIRISRIDALAAGGVEFCVLYMKRLDAFLIVVDEIKIVELLQHEMRRIIINTRALMALHRINKTLDDELKKFATRRLDEEYPYLILDARYEKVREDGVIRTRAVMIAIGINWDGRRSVLAVELANRESQTSWKEFLIGLKQRGLSGVEFVVSDHHLGLKKAIGELLPEAIWQRCYVHFLRNALDHLPRKADDDCLQELRWLYDRRNLEEARRDLGAWLAKWQKKYPKLCNWVEENIEETLSFYRLPLQHHKHLKSTNMLERLNEEIKRRTLVVRIFPNAESCLRLVRALATESHENWIEATRYLSMDLLKEHRKEMLQKNTAA